MVRGSNPGGTRFSAPPDRPWDPPSLLYNGYRVFPGGKVRPGRAADHSPTASAAVTEEQSYTSTKPLGHNRACNGNTLPLLYSSLIDMRAEESGRRFFSVNTGNLEVGNPKRTFFSEDTSCVLSASARRTAVHLLYLLRADKLIIA